jgi:hypothetical protein
MSFRNTSLTMQFPGETPRDMRGFVLTNRIEGGAMVPLAIAGTGLGIVGLIVLILLVILVLRVL